MNGNTVNFKTPIGVFSSVDSQLRDLEAEVGRLERMLVELAEDDAKLQALLDTPWDRATELEELRARVDAINELLDRSERTQQ